MNERKHNPCRNPKPSEIKAARGHGGLTIAEAARLVCGTERAWERWEADPKSDENRLMHAGLWRLFQKEVGLDPDKPFWDQLRNDDVSG